jgi:hypothetical protein
MNHKTATLTLLLLMVFPFAAYSDQPRNGDGSCGPFGRRCWRRSCYLDRRRNRRPALHGQQRSRRVSLRCCRFSIYDSR